LVEDAVELSRFRWTAGLADAVRIGLGAGGGGVVNVSCEMLGRALDRVDDAADHV